MSRVTLRQVISAVKRLRGGKRGVRLNDVVDYISESLRQRAIRKALDVGVRNGTIERNGNRFKLSRSVAERRKNYGKCPKNVSKRKPALACTRKSRKAKLTPQNDKYSRRSRSEETSDGTHERKKSNWRRQRSVSSNGTSGTDTSNRTSRYTTRSRSRGHRDPSSSSSQSEHCSAVNSRLVSTRDSVELLKERLSQKSSGNRVSFEQNVSPCSATSIFPSFLW